MHLANTMALLVSFSSFPIFRFSVNFEEFVSNGPYVSPQKKKLWVRILKFFFKKGNCAPLTNTIHAMQSDHRMLCLVRIHLACSCTSGITTVDQIILVVTRDTDLIS